MPAVFRYAAARLRRYRFRLRHSLPSRHAIADCLRYCRFIEGAYVPMIRLMLMLLHIIDYDDILMPR